MLPSRLYHQGITKSENSIYEYKFMYQEFLTNDCLVMFGTTQSLVMSTGSVHSTLPGIATNCCTRNCWPKIALVMFGTAQLLDLSRGSVHSTLPDIPGHVFENAPFAKIAFWQQTLCRQCPGRCLEWTDMSAQHVALDDVKRLHIEDQYAHDIHTYRLILPTCRLHLKGWDMKTF